MGGEGGCGARRRSGAPADLSARRGSGVGEHDLATVGVSAEEG
jgi:hypothetical protein